MPTLNDLQTMTGPQILAYNREHPGELDALAEVCFVDAGWGRYGPCLRGELLSLWTFFWKHPKHPTTEFLGERLHPTLDANQTRRLVEAVGEKRRFDFLMYLEDFLFGGKLKVGPFIAMAAEYMRLTAPLELVTAAAILALGDNA